MASKHRITVGEELRYDSDLAGIHDLSTTHASPQGAWSAGTYGINAVVTYNGSTYRSKVNGNTATPGADATKWEVWGGGTSTEAAYASNKTGTTQTATNTALSRIESGRLLAVSTLGAASDKALLLGVSMGGLNSLNYARANPSKVAGIIGIIPVSDLDDMRVNNRGGLRSSVDTAWAVSYPTALPTRANPSGAANMAILSGIPYQAYYSSADTVVNAGTVTTLAVAIGGAATQVSNTLDHSDAILANIDKAAIKAFLIANGA